jgi:hypothetical protein
MIVPAKSRAAWLQSDSNVEVGQVRSQHCATLSLMGTASPQRDAQPLHLPADPASAEKTRAALLALDLYPDDNSALTSLWEENHGTIEAEMNHHLHTSSDPHLLEHMLSRLVSTAKFFCEEIDDPKAWVARCAHLEARRCALEFAK